MIPYTVLFYEMDRPAVKSLAFLGDTPPTPSAGGGGFQLVTLPKRKAVTVWQGRDVSWQMTIAIVFDSQLGSVQTSRETLKEMWAPPDAKTEPPVIRIMAGGDIVPLQDKWWVVSDLQWGDGTADLLGNITTQKMTVLLMEYTPDQELRPVQKQKKKAQQTYTVKKGDTLATIAKRFKVASDDATHQVWGAQRADPFGTPGPAWQTLGEAQHPPIHDPRSIHVGQVLIIP